MARQQFFFYYFMRKEPNISHFKKLNNAFLSIDEPTKLAHLLGINMKLLIHLTKKRHYKLFITHHKKKKRIIAEPEPMLKHVQQKMNDYLQAVYFFQKPENVQGYVKNPTDAPEKCSFITNAASHCGKPFVINADIFRFFPSITGIMVRDVFLNPPFNFNNNLASALALLCICKNWLPTGAPTSPVISNFVCLKLDGELQILAETNGYRFTRYADDLTFSGEKKPDETFKQQLTGLLDKYHFKLNFKKYRVQSRQSRQMVTGIVINQKPNVNRKYIRLLRAIEHDIKTNGLENAAKRSLGRDCLLPWQAQQFKNSVDAKVRYVKFVRGIEM